MFELTTNSVTTRHRTLAKAHAVLAIANGVEGLKSWRIVETTPGGTRLIEEG